MGFADEVAAERNSAARPSRIYEVRDALGPKDWAVFVDLLRGRDVSCSQIGRALRKRNVRINDSTLVTWRNRLSEGWQP